MNYNLAMIIQKLSSKGKLLLVALPLLVLAVIFLLFFLIDGDYGNQNDLVAPINVDNISVGSDILSIDGKHLYLNGKPINRYVEADRFKKYLPYANFFVLTKMQPLFASEEIDAKVLAESVENLKGELSELGEYAGISGQEQIVPFSLLESLAKVSVAEKTYLEKPTLENGHNLVVNYESALRGYRLDVKQLLSDYEQYYPKSRVQEFSSMKATTTNQIIQADLELHFANTEALAEEIARRRLLLEGKEVRLKPIIGSQKVGYRKVSVPTFLDKQTALGVDEEYQSNLRGPYIVRSSCFTGKDADNYFYVYDQRLYGRKVFMPKLATENFYTGTGSSAAGYSLIMEGNTYRCDDLSYQAELLAVDQFQQKYGKVAFTNSPGYHKLPLNVRWRLSRLREFEDSYYRDSYKNYQNLVALNQLYLDAYRTVASNGLEQKQQASDLLGRYELIRNKLSGVAKIVDTTFFVNYLNDYYRDTGAAPERLVPYLVTRNAYSFSLLGFTPTVWRLDEKPKYLSGEYSTKLLNTYTELVKKLPAQLLEEINKAKTPLQSAALR